MVSNKLEAYKIIAEIQQAVKSSDSSVIVRESNTPQSLRKALRRLLVNEGLGERVVCAVDGRMVFVRVKSKPRAVVLEDLVRKMLNHIDDEGMFEEALEVLDGKQ